MPGQGSTILSGQGPGEPGSAVLGGPPLQGQGPTVLGGQGQAPQGQAPTVLGSPRPAVQGQGPAIPSLQSPAPSGPGLAAYGGQGSGGTSPGQAPGASGAQAPGALGAQAPGAFGAQAPGAFGAQAPGAQGTQAPATSAQGTAGPGAPGLFGQGGGQAPPAATAPTTVERPNLWLPAGTAKLQALDKVNAQATALTIKVGQSATLGSLTITVKSCVVRPPDQPADAAAFLDITDSHAEASGFDGWILQAEPSASMLQHPIYDLRVTGCA